MEGVVFEWLSYNNTPRNDWFFMMWWGMVGLWAVFGWPLVGRLLPANSSAPRRDRSPDAMTDAELREHQRRETSSPRASRIGPSPSLAVGGH